MAATVQPSIRRAARYRIADLTVDSGQRRVARNGQVLHLGKLTYEMFVALVEAAPNVVTQDELAETVWRGRTATPETVAQRAKLLRLALDDDPKHPRYIEVLRGHGYRLIPPVERESNSGSSAAGESPPELAPALPAAAEPAVSPVVSPDRRRSRRSLMVWTAGALLTAAVIGAWVWFARDRQVTSPPTAGRPSAQAAAKSIAVLPFADMSREQDQQYFSDGLTEEILNVLAQSPELRVIARTSSFSFRGDTVDIPTVARKLNVSHVLEGSVRKSGNQVRITAQLVDAATAEHVWSQTYDRELRDIFNVQSDIAASVANALHVALGNKTGASAPATGQTYELVLRANFFFQRRGEGDLERARMYYQQAIDRDPNFARAWAGLAGVYWIMTIDAKLPRDVGLEKLRDAAERAVALDPNLPEAHLRLVNYLWSVGRAGEAREHLRRAAVLQPNNPLLLGFMAGIATQDGRWDEAIALGRRVTAANPLSPLYRGNFAYDLFLAGRLDEAKSESLKATELDPSRPPEVFAYALILEHRFDEARRLVEAWPASGGRAQCLAFVYHALGRKSDADAALKDVIRFLGPQDPDRVAEVLAYRGETDEAFKWLEAEKRLPLERQQPVWVHSPFLKPLHSDARWKELAASVRG